METIFVIRLSPMLFSHFSAYYFTDNDFRTKVAIFFLFDENFV